jgi:hypothetical protein
MAGDKSELKALIKSHLGDSYYYSDAPESATYPYRVGELATSFNDENSEVFQFELDYWGRKDTDLDNLIGADAGNGNSINPSGLHNAILRGSKTVAFFTREGQTSIADPDRNLRRIRVTYTVRTYYF